MATPRYRFTAYDLESCVELARTVHENGGALSRDALAHHLGYKSSSNGAFNTRLANARLFGLVDGSSELSPSDRAKTILFPDYPAAAAKARLDAFESVPLYAEVLKTYHGQPLPSEDGLKNALRTRWSVNADKVDMVHSRLLECAEQAGLFEAAGDRSKMLRPATNGSAQGAQSTETRPVAAAEPAPSLVHGSTGVASNALVQAALSELPVTDEATEQQLRQWLAFFESALRVVYRLPASGGPP